MTKPNKITGRISLMFAGAAAMMFAGVAGASAQQQDGQMVQGWHKRCAKQEDIDICSVRNEIIADTGQLVTAIYLVEMSGKENRRALQVVVPTGRMVPPGVQLQIDGGQPRKLDYLVCIPDRCVAEVPLSDEIVANFKRGQEITLMSVNFQNQPNALPLTLAGFTAAYDGPPLAQAAADELDTRVQDFVSRNSEDWNRRLQEAQDRAKAAE